MTIRQRTPSSRTAARVDAAPAAQTTTRGLTNARTRVVGDRSGPLADGIVAVVRLWHSLRTTLARGVIRSADVVTPLGWTVVVFVPIAFAVGYRFGWLELVAMAFAGLSLVVVAVLYLIGRAAVAIDIEVHHRRVVVGQDASGLLTAANPSRRPVLGIQIEIPLGVDTLDVAVPRLAAGAEFRREFRIPTSRRGVLQIGPARSVRADPFGMVHRELVFSGAREIFVHPRTVAVRGASTGLIRDLEGKPTRDLSSSDVAFHALREYAPGDDRRYIHWKSTAKTGTPMVRQFEETRRSLIVVALSLAESDYAADDEFELAVSCVGSLGLRAIRDSREVSVVVGQSTPEFAKRKVLGVRHLSALTPSRLLDDLAAVERTALSLTTLDVARVAAERVVGISVAYLICGSLPTVAELRAASVLFPFGVEVIAVVCDTDAVPGLRRVAGLSILTIGYLEELQRSLARVAAV